MTTLEALAKILMLAGIYGGVLAFTALVASVVLTLALFLWEGL